MPRYFLELSYRGTRYSGFQVQQNAHTIQAEVEKAMALLLRQGVSLTGSSRTDAGVHAMQNYFHFDMEGAIPTGTVYRLNAILPADISVHAIHEVGAEAHSRFDAIARRYRYVLYGRKDPFLDERAWFYPYPLDQGILDQVAAMILEARDFTSFAKRNSQVKTFICKIEESRWERTNLGWEYHVKANRFLRGMVRGLVGTMLQAGRGHITPVEFKGIIEGRNNQLANFAAPGKGLYLMGVDYPDGYFGRGE